MIKIEVKLIRGTTVNAEGKPESKRRPISFTEQNKYKTMTWCGLAEAVLIDNTKYDSERQPVTDEDVY